MFGLTVVRCAYELAAVARRPVIEDVSEAEHDEKQVAQRLNLRAEAVRRLFTQKKGRRTEAERKPYVQKAGKPRDPQGSSERPALPSAHQHHGQPVLGDKTMNARRGKRRC